MATCPCPRLVADWAPVYASPGPDRDVTLASVILQGQYEIDEAGWPIVEAILTLIVEAVLTLTLSLQASKLRQLLDMLSALFSG